MSAPPVPSAGDEQLRIEALGSHHDRAAFSCGKPEQDAFLRKYAAQREARNMSRTFVLVSPLAPNTIVGFYSLSNYTIAISTLPDPLQKGLPRHQPVPATLLGQLAVAQQHQHSGLGKTLLLHALRQTLRASTLSAAYGVVVHAASEDLIPFYTRYGFISLPETSLHLIAPMTLVARLFPDERITPPGVAELII